MKNYILILLSLVIISCQKTNTNQEEIIEVDIIINACGVTTFSKLAWAQDLIAGKGTCENNLLAGARLTMYDYKGEKVFYFDRNPTSLGICTQAVYNCSGVRIVDFASETSKWLDFEKNRSNAKLLWTKQ